MTKPESDLTPQVAIKKRIMFVTQDDFYFLTYNLIILLSQLECIKAEKVFLDIRKIAFLIDFISDHNLALLLARGKALDGNVRAADKNVLNNCYSKGKERVPFINRLAYALEKKGYITIVPDQEDKTIGAYLNLDRLPSGFTSAEMFDNEIKNVALIKGSYSRIRTTSLDTFLENVFRNNGVSTWLD